MEEEIELIPVEGKSGFYRDPESTAIINCDKKALSQQQLLIVTKRRIRII